MDQLRKWSHPFIKWSYLPSFVRNKLNRRQTSYANVFPLFTRLLRFSLMFGMHFDFNFVENYILMFFHLSFFSFSDGSR